MDYSLIPQSQSRIIRKLEEELEANETFTPVRPPAAGGGLKGAGPTVRLSSFNPSRGAEP